MTDPNQQRRENSEGALEGVGEVAEIGIDAASEGVIDMALDGISAAADIAGDVVGGVLSIFD